MVVSASSVPSLRGHCGSVERLDTLTILCRLGWGAPLPSGLRSGMETSLMAGLGHVRLHTDSAADCLAEYFGAEAVAIHGHIAFRRDRYHPESVAGAELLRHELEHTLQPWGPLRGWFTVRYQGSTPSFSYTIANHHGTIAVTESSENTHKALTRYALRQVGGFGDRAWRNILEWVEEVDNPHYKNQESDMQNLVSLFPDLSGHTIGQLHAFRFERIAQGRNGAPIQPQAIGMSGQRENTTAVSARLLGPGHGLIGRLLILAAEKVGAGEATMDYGFRLLGISLHAIQDYFSHYVPVSVGGGQDLRRLYGNQREFWILEDDPMIDQRERWRAAQTYSQHQLWNFRARLKRDHPPVVWKAEAKAAAAP